MKPLSKRALWFPPRLKLRGTQLAGWTPRGKQAAQSSGMLFDEDVEITLPDGTILLADLFRPRDVACAPALVSWAAYIKDIERLGGGPVIDESGITAFVIDSGYAIIRVQPRGTGRSGGSPPEDRFQPQEARDCHDTIEWVAAQPWCDGNVGMTGMSYFGMAQLKVAATRPPHLKAIFPLKAMTDIYRHGLYKGGAPYNGAIELMAVFEQAVPPRIPARIRHLLSYLLNWPRFAMEMSDPAKTDQVAKKMLVKNPPGKDALKAFVTHMYDRAFDEPHWREVSAGTYIDDIDIPVLIGTDYGAQGFHFFGAFELWHRLKSPKFLFFGPPEYTFPWANYQRELVAWYDWQLKGVDTGYAELPPVRYWLRGAERWDSAIDWPLPDARPVKLYLATGQGDHKPSQSLAWTRPVDATTTSFIARHAATSHVPGVDSIETEILRYRTEPLDHDVEAVGPVRLQVVLSATAIDTYVIARLCDIAPDGTRTKLAWGWLRASHRTVDHERSNPTEIVHDHRREAALQLVPGQPTAILLSLTPIANLFRAGHRIELEIASRPEFLYSATGEGFDMFAWDPVPYPSRNNITHGGDEPSWVEINVRNEPA